MSNDLKKSLHLWLQIKDRDYLRVFELEPQTGKTPEISKKKEKLRVLTVKSAFLRSICPVFLAYELARDSNPLWMSSSLGSGCQVVWACEHSLLSPSGNQRVTWRFDVYTEALTQD